jgi:O-antigen ligase
MDLIKQYQPFGVGIGQFGDYTDTGLTAHNSYVLAAAENGLPGSILWSLLVYVTVKIPYVVSKRPPDGLDPRLVPLALALMVSFAGILVGIFFLSFCYKPMLYIYFGLSGALYLAAKKADPSFSVKVTRKEVIWIVVLDIALLGFIFVYSRLQGSG